MENGEVRKKLVDIGPSPESCWLWLGSVSKKTGYGKKQFCGRTISAHRWMWQNLMGPVPDGKVINHLCGNRCCVNPHHLEVVTQAENCQHGAGAKLTSKQAGEIKRAKTGRKWGDGARLAKKYGVSGALIHDIWNGRAWRDEVETMEHGG